MGYHSGYQIVITWMGALYFIILLIYHLVVKPTLARIIIANILYNRPNPYSYIDCTYAYDQPYCSSCSAYRLTHF